MKKKLAAIFAGISLLIFFPEKLSASISRANIIGKWDCKESTYFDWGTLFTRSEIDIREDGIGYASGTASFLFTDTPPRNYKIMVIVNWSLSGNSWTTQYKKFQAMQIGPNHDQNSIDLNKEVELGTIFSAEVLKLNKKESVFLFDNGTISYCSKL
tara:strand:- start:275 stop:742 length:468 start_codon:yes stop_codon:yes gene_type:complete